MAALPGRRTRPDFARPLTRQPLRGISAYGEGWAEEVMTGPLGDEAAIGYRTSGRPGSRRRPAYLTMPAPC